MNAALQRAHLLYDQGRYPEAEAFVRQALTESPDDAECQAMLALCLVAQDELLEGASSRTSSLVLAAAAAMPRSARRASSRLKLPPPASAPTRSTGACRCACTSEPRSLPGMCGRPMGAAVDI